jgi:hypothetical protein
MKTRTIIVFCLILLLTGLALTGFPQGIENNGGYITASSSNYIQFNGGGNMTLKSTTADRTTLGNTVVNFTGSGTYKLTIPDDSYITVDGNLTLNDSLLVKASSSGMASLITNGTVSGAYSRVEQHLTQNQWHIISSPVSAAKANVYAGCYLLKWYEPDSTWSYITSLTTPLNVTQGYFVWSASGIGSPTDVKFKGLINTGNKSATMYYTSSASHAGKGWNLIGNPYPSAIEWNSSWTKTNVDATIYVYDGSQYLTWNYNLGGYGTKTDGSIPSTQGFWVHANASSPSLTIPNSERIHSSQAFYKSTDAGCDMFDFSIAGNSYSDNIKVGFYTGATTGFDSEYDAEKLYGIPDAPQLYTMGKFHEYAVNILPYSGKTKTVPLGIRTGAAGNYILSFDGYHGLNPVAEVFIEDKYFPGKLVSLTKNPDYTMNLPSGSTENRYLLHFMLMSINNSIYKTQTPDDMENLVQIHSDRTDVYINYRSDAPASMAIYDLWGREILRGDLVCDNMNKFSVSNGKGYYIVQVFNDWFSKTEKVYLH